MNRYQLLAVLTKQLPRPTSSDVEMAAKTILDPIANRLVQGGRVEIRRCRNPKTGERVAGPAKRAPHFKPGIELSERVNVEVSG